MPAPSVPGTIGNFALRPHGRHDPSRTRPSQEPTPAAWRAMRTSRGPGFGTGRRWGVRTEGGPNSSIAAAFIVCGIVDWRAPAAIRFVMASPSGLGPVLRSEKETSDFSFSTPSLEGMLAARTSSKLSTGGGPATVQSDGFGPFLRTARLGYARTGTIRPRGERRLREPPPARDFSGSVAAADISLYTPGGQFLVDAFKVHLQHRNDPRIREIETVELGIPHRTSKGQHVLTHQLIHELVDGGSGDLSELRHLGDRVVKGGVIRQEINEPDPGRTAEDVCKHSLHLRKDS